METEMFPPSHFLHPPFSLIGEHNKAGDSLTFPGRRGIKSFAG